MEENSNNEICLDKLVEFNKLDSNTLVIFRLDKMKPAIYDAIDNLQKSFGPILKEKNITFLILKSGTEIETVSPKILAELGYYKKEKSLIIH